MSNSSLLLFVLPRFSGGGAERVMMNLVCRLHQQGNTVRLVVFDNEGPLRSMLPANLPIDDLGTKSLRKSIASLVSHIRHLHPTHIYSTLGYVNLALLSCKPLLPKGSQLWVREANLPSVSLPNNPYSWLMWQGYRWLYRHSARVLVTSERMKREFVEIFKVPEMTLCTMYNPVDEIGIRTKAKADINRASGAGLRFVAAGRLTYQKGFDRLLRWFVDFDHLDSHLTILGDGELASELKLLVSALEIADRVSFVGFTENPWGWFAGADAFLLSSRWEGMSNAVLESLACGTPVIATNESGGIAEVAEQVHSTDPGGVTVTSNRGEFLQAMSTVVINHSYKVRPSLLPEFYQLDSVVKTFTEWVEERR